MSNMCKIYLQKILKYFMLYRFENIYAGKFVQKQLDCNSTVVNVGGNCGL